MASGGEPNRPEGPIPAITDRDLQELLDRLEPAPAARHEPDFTVWVSTRLVVGFTAWLDAVWRGAVVQVETSIENDTEPLPPMPDEVRELYLRWFRDGTPQPEQEGPEGGDDETAQPPGSAPPQTP